MKKKELKSFGFPEPGKNALERVKPCLETGKLLLLEKNVPSNWIVSGRVAHADGSLLPWALPSEGALPLFFAGSKPPPRTRAPQASFIRTLRFGFNSRRGQGIC